ncbi:uncharacterized protein LOC124967013 [Sciurus carolinensis]|uniref:uncharacterized protein LOC124967013 n=1 Tax=Sciurus carolinensis TaxID=30640 RepID=UPI001FB40F4C|nr:uncharacterized protein LOC124967013 [Sciurus carolinensis]
MPVQTAGHVKRSSPCARVSPRCAVGPGVQGHRDPAPSPCSRGSQQHRGYWVGAHAGPGLPDVYTAAVRPGEVAVADGPGAAGGVAAGPCGSSQASGNTYVTGLERTLGGGLVQGPGTVWAPQPGRAGPATPILSSSRCLAECWTGRSGSQDWSRANQPGKRTSSARELGPGPAESERGGPPVCYQPARRHGRRHGTRLTSGHSTSCMADEAFQHLTMFTPLHVHHLLEESRGPGEDREEGGQADRWTGGRDVEDPVDPGRAGGPGGEALPPERTPEVTAQSRSTHPWGGSRPGPMVPPQMTRQRQEAGGVREVPRSQEHTPRDPGIQGPRVLYFAETLKEN